MKKCVNISCSVILAVLTAVLSAGCAHRTEVPVIPRPASVQWHCGQFALSPQTAIYTDASETFRTALAGYLAGTNLAQLPFADEAGKSDMILLLLSDDAALGSDEAYKLTVKRRKVEITARHEAGLFYGMQTLLQLLDNGDGRTLAAMTVTDSPRFPYRGLHLDVSRNFFDKEFIKKQLDAMAYFKLNRLHWHLTDGAGWRIEIKKYPRLTDFAAWRPFDNVQDWWSGGRTFCDRTDPRAHGGFYTQQDIKEVVAYAAERQITIVPEIEMPGHSEEVLAAYPELSCSGKPYADADFCIGTEQTFEFLENVLLEVMELFPSEYIHIGGDEASKESWRTCPRCRQRMAEEHLADVDELQSYMIHRMERFLNAHGRKLIGWDEILEGGLSPTATVMSWRGEEGGLQAVRAGNNAIMTPGKYCYLDAYQDAPQTQPLAIGGYLTLEKVYSYEPLPDSLPAPEAARILGVQGNVWTEYIATPEHAEYMIYPRILALAEVGWSPAGQKDWNGFRQRALQAVDVLRGKGYSPFPLDKEVGDKPESFRPEEHLALHCAVTYNGCPYAPKYAAGGNTALTDGVRGGWLYNDDRWQGFIGCDLDVTIDLGSLQPIHEVTAQFMQLRGPYVWMPAQVVISASADGQDFEKLAVVDNDISPELETLLFKDFGWQGNAEARFVRYQAKQSGIDGGWIFTDEIIVR